jgi:Fur family transcriptional regulator, ferric uptake regulator
VTKTDEMIELLKHAIREAGLRATPARVATLQFLRESSTPQTHAAVADFLGPLGADKATAYRNLNDMADAGLLRRTELGDHLWRFEAIASDAGHSHPHFLCVDCGAIRCLEDVQLTSASEEANSQFGEVTEILLRGHCNDCR